MTPRGAWAGCAATGIAASLCAWAFGRVGLVACGPTGGLGPIIAFELVRSPTDVATLFGAPPCTTPFVAAQKAALLLDGPGFIPCYAAFLIFGAVAAGARGGVKVVLLALIGMAGLADEIEGYILGRILDGLPGTPAQIDALSWVVHIKFALLGIATLAIGGLLLDTRRLSAVFPGVAIGAGALIALDGLTRSPDPRMMTGFVIAWVVLLLTALIAIWRPLLFLPARAGPLRDQAMPSV